MPIRFRTFCLATMPPGLATLAFCSRRPNMTTFFRFSVLSHILHLKNRPQVAFVPARATARRGAVAVLHDRAVPARTAPAATSATAPLVVPSGGGRAAPRSPGSWSTLQIARGPPLDGPVDPTPQASSTAENDPTDTCTADGNGIPDAVKKEIQKAKENREPLRGSTAMRVEVFCDTMSCIKSGRQDSGPLSAHRLVLVS